MSKVMTNTKFVEMAKYALSQPSIYARGAFGWELNREDNLERLKTINTASRNNKLTAAANEAAELGVDIWAWDCINLAKGILWGWCGNNPQLKWVEGGSKNYGGAKYQSNGVPDTTIDAFYSKFTENPSSDFSNIEPGEILYYNNSFGHVGIYVGDGLCIEATSSWQGKVLMSGVTNCAQIYEGRTRKWWQHGKLTFIDYVKEEPAIIKCPCCGANLSADIILKAYEE